MPSTTARLVFEFLKERSNAPLFGVPYKGSSSSMTEMMGGQIPLTIDTVTASRPLIESGKLKAIAVTSSKPSELLPGVKPVAEQGMPGFEVLAWNALYAPKGTPNAIIQLLNAEMQKIMAQPETRQKLLSLGFDAEAALPSSWPSSVAPSAASGGRSLRVRASRPSSFVTAEVMVAKDGIEPPTQGFSVLCSTN